MTIIAFHYAGGNRYSYDFLKPYLNGDIEIEVFENRGRGKRILEDPLESVDAIIEDLWISMTPLIRKKKTYCLYGHSMGALIALLVCHKIQENGLDKPMRLVVSGKKSPRLQEEKKIWKYPSQEFWEELILLGGIHKEIEDEIQLRDFFEPIIKADIKAIEEYSFTKSKQLDIPIDVLYGDEELENENDFLDWNKETTNIVNFYPFTGNHFFINGHAQSVANHFIRKL